VVPLSGRKRTGIRMGWDAAVGEQYEQRVRSDLSPCLPGAQDRATALANKQQACYLDKRTARLQARRFQGRFAAGSQ